MFSMARSKGADCTPPPVKPQARQLQIGARFSTETELLAPTDVRKITRQKKHSSLSDRSMYAQSLRR